MNMPTLIEERVPASATPPPRADSLEMMVGGEGAACMRIPNSDPCYTEQSGGYLVVGPPALEENTQCEGSFLWVDTDGSSATPMEELPSQSLAAEPGLPSPASPRPPALLCLHTGPVRRTTRRPTPRAASPAWNGPPLTAGNLAELERQTEHPSPEAPSEDPEASPAPTDPPAPPPIIPLELRGGQLRRVSQPGIQPSPGGGVVLPFLCLLPAPLVRLVERFAVWLSRPAPAAHRGGEAPIVDMMDGGGEGIDPHSLPPATAPLPILAMITYLTSLITLLVDWMENQG